MKNQATSIGMSIPNWIMSVVDKFRNNRGTSRSHYAARGILKQIVFEMRTDLLFEHFGNAVGEEIDREDRIEMTFSVPAAFPAIIREHCNRCGYDINNFVDLAVVRFIVAKDATPGFWQSVEATDSADFYTVIN